MRIELHTIAILTAVIILGVSAAALADEAPIAGTVKSVDAAAGTFLMESTSKGKVREVVIHVRPESKIIRFTRSSDAAKPGFQEQAATLADLKPGWMVSVKTRHEGPKEVADTVRVVHEKEK